MKNFFLLFFCFFFSFSAFAQEEDSYVATKKDKHKEGLVLFISGGVNFTQYISNVFFDYIGDKNFTPVNDQKTSPSHYYIDLYNTTPSINKNKSSISPIYGLGLEFKSTSDKKIKFNHVLQIGYTQFSGTFSYSHDYDEKWYSTGSPAKAWTENIKDTAVDKYIQTAISFGYKFQPTYKNFFLSIGINGFYNLLKVDEHKTIYINGIFYDEFSAPVAYSKNSASDQTLSTHFISIPFDLGAGYSFKIKNIVFKPAFYFNPCILKGYNFYTVSLGIGYDFKNA